MVQFSQVRDILKGRTPTYEKNHKPVLEVPKGGSMCANCKYVSDDQGHCKNKHYIKFMGTSKLPYPADQMCSDWWDQ
jgi:hypothetical protein